jgi:diaminohydroxyphosphoribosylaminopyrimidine deaminase / 5-amino-6-(5-phosphoribosylamino)uracil reductase
MAHAIRLATRGKGWVNPNPLVGALLVNDHRVIGEGYHKYYGGPHAEINAMANATGPVRGSTLVITLEPCIHQGKTPPCAPQIVEKGISEVIIGMKDPNPLVNGKGISYLESHGLRVISGIRDEEISRQNEIFIKYITTGLPFGILKSAMTLDGKIATVNRESRWISGEKSRKYVHEIRHHVSAVMVGINTVLADNPLLNVRRRKKKSKDPLKVIVDSTARLSPGSAVLVNQPQLVILATTDKAGKDRCKELERMGVQVVVCPALKGRVDLSYLAAMLGKMGVDSILIEGGGELAFSALQQGIVDKVTGFITPLIVGGKDSLTPVGGKGIGKLADAIRIRDVSFKRTGEDLYYEGYVEQ